MNPQRAALHGGVCFSASALHTIPVTHQTVSGSTHPLCFASQHAISLESTRRIPACRAASLKRFLSAGTWTLIDLRRPALKQLSCQRVFYRQTRRLLAISKGAALAARPKAWTACYWMRKTGLARPLRRARAAKRIGTGSILLPSASQQKQIYFAPWACFPITELVQRFNSCSCSD